MQRIAGVAGLLAATSLAQTRPTGTSLPLGSAPSGAWLPLAVGSYWDYETPDGQVVTLDCTSRSGPDSDAWFTLSRRVVPVPLPTSESWSVRTDGIYARLATANARGRLEQPIRVLQLPAGISASWRESKERALDPASGGRGLEQAALTYRAEIEALDERVKTKAGTFDTLRVAVRVELEGQPERKLTYWFARGIGIVKVDDDQADQPLALTLTRYVAADAPLDPDLVAAAEKALAASPTLAARGKPSSLVQLRAPELRVGFANRFCRACWEQGSILLWEQAGVAAVLDTERVDDWNRMLEREGVRFTTGPNDWLQFTPAIPKLLQGYEGGLPGRMPGLVRVQNSGTELTVTVKNVGIGAQQLIFVVGTVGRLKMKSIEAK